MNKTSKDDLPYFHETPVDEELLAKFDIIKKLGARFGKVYINVKDSNLTIETTDKTNSQANGAEEPLADGIEENDLSMLFEYKNFVNLVSVLELADEKEFKIKFAYVNDGGLMHITSTDSTEQYFLLSKEDI